MLCNIQAKPIFSNDKQADSSLYINSLKDLVIATQKTRGLTNSYLNGNLIALMLVQEAKDNMRMAIGTMESLELSSDPIVSKRASELNGRLMELNRKGLKLKPEVAFKRYTEEIEQILLFAQTVSKRSSEHMSPFAKETSIVMMEQMLPLSEYVGQLRGMGSGIAAKGKVSKEQKEDLDSVIALVVKFNEDFQKSIKNSIVQGKNYYSQDIQTRVAKIDSSVKEYISFVKRELYKETIAVNPDDYFTSGTQIINQIISVYDEANRAVLKDSKGWL
jgi:hypothetical protein